MTNAIQYPKVSVVIPMYNVSKYIEKCIRSVLAQTLKNFEVVCVDDGCTDDTLEKLAQFDDDRIRLIRQENKGLSGARNTGIRNARGQYIALLDADDFWARQKLACHVAHLDEHDDVGISYCPSIFVDEDNHPLGIGQYPKLTNIDAKTVLCRNPIGNGSAPVIRQEVFKAVAFETANRPWVQYFDEQLRQSEDIELWIRMALETDYKFEGIPRALTFYRVNAGGLSANLQKQYASWCHAIDKNRLSNPEFFKRYASLARAYQLRYLGRRALQSRNRWQAIKLSHQALFTNIRILFEEPARTLATLACSWLCMLPRSIYNAIERYMMYCAALLRRPNCG